MAGGSQMKLGIVVDTDTRATKQEFSALRTDIKKQADAMGGDWEAAAGKVEDALREAGARDDLIQAAKRIGSQGPTEIEKMRTALREVGDQSHTTASDIQDAIDDIDLKLDESKFDNFKSELKANAVEAGSQVIQSFTDGITSDDALTAVQGATDILFQTGAATGNAGLLGAALGLSLVSGLVNQFTAQQQAAEQAAADFAASVVQSGLDAATQTFINDNVSKIVYKQAGAITTLADAQDLAKTSGQDLSDVLNGVSGDTDAAAKVTKGYADQIAALKQKIDDERAAGTLTSDLYDRQEAQLNGLKRDQGHWNDLIGATNDTLSTGAQRAQMITDANAKLAGAFDKTTDSASRTAQAVDGIPDAVNSSVKFTVDDSEVQAWLRKPKQFTAGVMVRPGQVQVM